MATKSKILILVVSALLSHNEAFAGVPGTWQAKLRLELQKIEQTVPRKSFGVFIRELSTGEEISFYGDEKWYLASGVKVAVACAVFRAIEQGALALDKEIQFDHSDRIDGSGETNYQPSGSLLTIEFLLHQMLVHSDNTASDLLIREVGLDKVNQCASPFGISRITTLADVRRHAYSAFHPKAWELTNADYLALGAIRKEPKKLRKLSSLLAVPYSDLRAKSLHEAFGAYYSKKLNSASLRAYSDFLTAIVRGEALSEKSTESLINIMKGAQTGSRRLIAGFPDQTIFAHKTGTQVERVCDLGITWNRSRKPVIIAACTRGFATSAKAEKVLRRVGRAISESGLLSR